MQAEMIDEEKKSVQQQDEDKNDGSLSIKSAMPNIIGNVEDHETSQVVPAQAFPPLTRVNNEGSSGIEGDLSNYKDITHTV